MNGIYGTQAMDVFRPEYLFDETGDMFVNREDLVTPENFEEKKPARCKVLYTYGMRIVAGSRMHLIIAIELIYKALPNVLITGGDTDSIKIACPEGVTPDDIKRALEPLEQAVTEAIRVTQRRVRKLYPDKASQLTDIGCFDYEGTAEYHMEAWNKARVYIKDGKPHITCAGLMRPDGAYHIETWMSDMLERIRPEQLLPLTLGYNTTVLHSVSHALEHKRPYPLEQMYLHVTDYLGNTAKVTAHKAVALYPAGRDLGSLAKPANLDNIDYLEKHLGRYVEKRERVITVDEDGHAALWIRGEDDLERFRL